MQKARCLMGKAPIPHTLTWASHRIRNRSIGNEIIRCLATVSSSQTPQSIYESFCSAFVNQHIGSVVSGEDTQAMLKAIGVDSVEALVDQTVPSSIRLPTWEQASSLHGIPIASRSEAESTKTLEEISNLNTSAKSYIGMGYYNCILPPVIRRHLFENATWYTSYTAYQAEISQGRLESLLNFQTLVIELTGMDISNASLLDEASAAAEAMSMAYKAKGSTAKKMFFVSSHVHPQTVDLIQSRASLLGIHVIVGDHQYVDFSELNQLFGALVQYPNTNGTIEDYTSLSKAVHELNAYLVVAIDPLALCLIKPPSLFKADIVIGSMQRFGVPMGFGGPHAAFLAASKQDIRIMPGRIIGITVDAEKNHCYRMTLQTREQHIRKDKATSNICTAQALLANVAAMFAVYHGPTGLQKIAKRVHFLTSVLKTGVTQLDYEVVNSTSFFDTLTIGTAPHNSQEVIDILESYGLNVRPSGGAFIGISLDETTTLEDVKVLLEALAEVKGKSAPDISEFGIGDNTVNFPVNLHRTEPFLQQSIFTSIANETEMMRYIKHLENKDLGLNTSMIPLGSCTMKLNPASTLIPILWPKFANIHPFAPIEQTKGYQKLVYDLGNYLGYITGFDGVSLQPNSGATGEYAGLAAIRAFHQSIGQGHRNVCIIPKSAHGTNAASAAMAGMIIKAVDSDKEGNVNLEHLENLAKANAENLSALMITYPSTFGVFEESIKRICEIIHQYGGNVYMDGANMNAQLGLTSPGYIGADVCHLNLHKTFAIPHGGGGPGVGPICVKKHLVPFLMSHSIVPPSLEYRGPAVSAAPFGSAMVLPISWMFINMLGLRGLKLSAQFAILNANYMMNRLKDHYAVKFTGRNGRCAHEFIISVESFKKSCGVDETDIAKRLMDYGFHSPTMSWPVHAALMVEPTESESKAELDRFCDALISIRQEIKQIESGKWPTDNNPLKNAPHTEKVVAADQWNYPYSRGVGAFPLPWIATRGKFWPSISRVNNEYGERNLICSCGDVSDYVS